MKNRYPLAGPVSRFGLALIVCACIVSACDTSNPPIPPSPTAVPVVPTATPPPPPTPTVDLAVDLDRARRAFDAGGELTYEEVVALWRAIVGDPADIRKITPIAKSFDAQEEMNAREVVFARKLARCRLKESIGWLIDRQRATDEKYQPVPNATDISVYMYDPYKGPSKDVSIREVVVMTDLNDQQVATLKYGQRLRFTGSLGLDLEQVTVKDAVYTLLDDDPPIPPPSADELKDVQISLSRSMCFGTCPDYTLTITADGRVTFDGQHYTRVNGTVNTTIEQAKIVELIKEIKKADFFRLPDTKEEIVLDAPSYTLSVHMGGQSKTHGAGSVRLGILMNRIDQIVNSAQWIK